MCILDIIHKVMHIGVKYWKDRQTDILYKVERWIDKLTNNTNGRINLMDGYTNDTQVERVTDRDRQTDHPTY